jgi:hypothetical protein
MLLNQNIPKILKRHKEEDVNKLMAHTKKRNFEDLTQKLVVNKQ